MPTQKWKANVISSLLALETGFGTETLKRGFDTCGKAVRHPGLWGHCRCLFAINNTLSWPLALLNLRFQWADFLKLLSGIFLQQPKISGQRSRVLAACSFILHHLPEGNEEQQKAVPSPWDEDWYILCTPHNHTLSAGVGFTGLAGVFDLILIWTSAVREGRK